MTDGLIKKASKKTATSARTLAQQAAKVVVEEQEKFAKSAKSQLTGEKKGIDRPVVDQVITDGEQAGPITTREEEQIKLETRKRLQELEEELEKLREERKRKEEEWKREQEAKMGTPGEGEVKKLLTEPTTKSKRGLPRVGSKISAVIKRKRGTRELGKRPTG
jgi:hypothetical protein